MAKQSPIRRQISALSSEVKGGTRAVAWPLGFMWALEIVDQLLLGGRLDLLGIHPRDLDHIWGILAAPFLHGGFGHLIANTLPFIVLGLLTMVRKRMDFYVVSIAGALSAGVGTWLVGATNSVHVGASGVIFAYLGFLLGRGFFERRFGAILMSLGVGLAFGGMLWGLVPYMQAGISWEGHLFGFLGGLATSRFLGQKISRKR